MFEITYLGAALAGVLSFFTPCVLPMVPFYLSYMGGLSMAELRGDGQIAPGAQRRLVVSSVCFALGVTTVFMALGMGAPLIAVGVAARSVLPKAGPWMEGVKKAFGIMLLAIYRPGAELPDEATIGGAVQNALSAIASITWIVQLVVRAVTKKAGVLVR